MSMSYYNRDPHRDEYISQPYRNYDDDDDDDWQSSNWAGSKNYGYGYGQRDQYDQFGPQRRRQRFSQFDQPRFQDQSQSRFGSSSSSSSSSHSHQFPSIRMTKSDQQYKIFCDVPGVSKSDLKLEVDTESQYEKTLTISGVRKFGERDSSMSERPSNVSVEKGSEQGMSSQQPYQSSQLGLSQGNQQQHGSLQSSQLAFPGSTQQQQGVVSTQPQQSSNLGIERSGQHESVGTSISSSSTVPQQQSNLGTSSTSTSSSSSVPQQSSVKVGEQPHEKTLGEKIRDVVDPTRWGSSNTSSTTTSSTSDSTSTTGVSNPNNDKTGYGRKGYGMTDSNSAPYDNRTTGEKIKDVVDPRRWGSSDRSSDRSYGSSDRSGYGSSDRSYGSSGQQWGQRDRGMRMGMGMDSDNEIQFSRTINLPSDADEKNIRAKLENGVLCICMPRLKSQSHMKSINVD